MENLYKYNDFLFESIINEIFLLVESEQAYTYEWDLRKEKDDEKPVTFEWDLTSNKPNTLEKLKGFLQKLPKDQIKKYFYKLLDKVKLLPERTRRKLLINFASVFLVFAPIKYLTDKPEEYKADKKIVKEFVNVTKKASFKVSQEIVALAEGDYSSDRGDTGNFVDFELNGKKVKRFIGSKYGISAPILQKYLGKLPKKEDMINLTYEQALDIYKNLYWDEQKIEKFCNQSVANLVYDGCVNQGVNGMKSVIRKTLNKFGVKIDDETNPFEGDWIKQLNTLNQQELFNTIKQLREERYKDAATYKRHGKGWLNRLEKIIFEE